MTCGTTYHINPAITDNAVLNDYQVVYMPSNNIFTNGGMADDRIVMTKSVSVGSGSYSNYTWGKKNVQLPTTYEFLTMDGKFIGYNGHNLKFYDIVYADGTLQAKEMPVDAVAALFPDLKIVLMSSAKDNVITVKKAPFATMSFLLLNDTDRDFYKYSFAEALPSDNPFKGLITVDTFGTVIFSHFGADDATSPAIKIDVVW